MRSRIYAACIALALVAPAFAAAGAAPAKEARGIVGYEETMNVGEDGAARVVTTVKLKGWDADRLDLPLNAAKVQDVSASIEGMKAGAAQAKAGDVNVIRVQLERKPAPDATLTVTYQVPGFLDWKKAATPRGQYRFSYTFSNATSASISGYALKVRLPAGYGISGITSSTPRATGEEVEPPYSFATAEGRTVLTLRSKSVGPAKTAAIAFAFQPAKRSAWPVLVAGLLVIGAALYAKRDVLTRTDFVKEAAA